MIKQNKFTNEEIYRLLDLITYYNKGIDAFDIIITEYPAAVQTILGKDENLMEYINSNSVRSILGNKIQIALGKKDGT